MTAKRLDMASRPEFVQHLCKQMALAGTVSARKMFGDYALYCDGKVVALVCDNALFVKPTPAGRALLAQAIEAPPYPGARPHFLIEEGIDEREWLGELIRATADSLPAPRKPSTRP